MTAKLYDFQCPECGKVEECWHDPKWKDADKCKPCIDCNVPMERLPFKRNAQRWKHND